MSKNILNITLGDLMELGSNQKLSVKDALPLLREWRDKHSLNDKETLKLFGVAMELRKVLNELVV